MRVVVNENIKNETRVILFDKNNSYEIYTYIYTRSVQKITGIFVF